MYDPVDQPEYRVGQRVIALDLDGLPWERHGGPYETTVLALHVMTHGDPQWRYELDGHPRYGGSVLLYGRQIRPAPAVIQLADLVTE